MLSHQNRRTVGRSINMFDFVLKGANASQLEKDIGSDLFPANEHFFGLVNVSIPFFSYHAQFSDLSLRAGGTGMAGVAAATPIFLLFRPNIFTFLNFPSRTEVHRFIHVEIAH